MKCFYDFLAKINANMANNDRKLEENKDAGTASVFQARDVNQNIQLNTNFLFGQVDEDDDDE